MKIKILFSLAVFFLSFQTAKAYTLYPSQCTEGTVAGNQSDCTHINDAKILGEQCKAQYNPSYCGSMSVYLSHMSEECNRLDPRPEDIDCSMITQNGIYGREAAKYASYVQSNSGKSTIPENNNITSQTGAGLSSFGFPDPAGGIKGILAAIINWMLGIIGVIAIIGFIISGLQYFFAAGDESKIETAKKNITYSIIGIVVALSGLVITRAIQAALNAVSF